MHFKEKEIKYDSSKKYSKKRSRKINNSRTLATHTKHKNNKKI
jgi:hypothetical protein